MCICNSITYCMLTYCVLYYIFFFFIMDNNIICLQNEMCLFVINTNAKILIDIYIV